MEKEEILKVNKMKKRNNFDEMEEQITLRSMAISSLTLQVICLIFILIRLFCINDKNVIDLIIIMFSDFSILELLIGKKLNSKTNLFCGIISSVIIVFLIVFYIFIILYWWRNFEGINIKK